MRSTPRHWAQQLKDLVGAPFRMVLLPDVASNRLGLTSLEDERVSAVLPWVQGRLLDIGAGTNRLVREHGRGVGVDVHDFGGGALILRDSRQLPFPDETFDTVTFIACLNHIPEREAALIEAWRVLKPQGRIVATMIDPVLSQIGHRLWWYGEDRHRGGMHEGEVFGFWPAQVRQLLTSAGFKLEHEGRFLYALNRLYVARKWDGNRAR